jgi:hypothetical protein
LKSNDELATKIDRVLEQACEKHQFVALSISARSPYSEILGMHHGYQGIENGTKPDDFTVYEIGSISKVFQRLGLKL